MAIILNNDVLYWFRMWQKVNPKICKCTSHYREDGLPLSDEAVCLRERNWRKYVEAREKAILGYNPKPNKKLNLSDLLQAFDED